LKVDRAQTVATLARSSMSDLSAQERADTAGVRFPASRLPDRASHGPRPFPGSPRGPGLQTRDPAEKDLIASVAIFAAWILLRGAFEAIDDMYRSAKADWMPIPLSRIEKCVYLGITVGMLTAVTVTPAERPGSSLFRVLGLVLAPLFIGVIYVGRRLQ